MLYTAKTIVFYWRGDNAMNLIKRSAYLLLPLCLLAIQAQAESVASSSADAQKASGDVKAVSETASAAQNGETAAGANDENVVDTVKIVPSKAANALVCRTERPLGSHIPKRVCRTNQEIEGDRDEAKKKMFRDDSYARRNSLMRAQPRNYNMKAYKASKGGR